jgi:HAMP domain-containing protein
MKLGNLLSGIRSRIFLCFFSIIFLFGIYGAISNYLLNENRSATERINNTDQPSITALTELELLLFQTKNLMHNWIKIDIENHPDKIKLREIHEKDYPALKEQLLSLQKDWNDKVISGSLLTLIKNVDTAFVLQQEIMSSLATFDSYEDIMVKIEGESKNDIVSENLNSISAQLHQILDRLKLTTSEQQVQMIDNMQLLARTNVILLFCIILMGLFLTMRLSRRIIKPVNGLHNLVNKVSRGELDTISIEITRDEIGQMVGDVQKMVEGLKTTATFANEIGKGNLQAEFTPLSQKDVLGNALITMRDNLIHVAREDKQRNWSNEGYATFGEILRNQYGSINEMLDTFLIKLVKYVQANQGWLYIVNDENEDEAFLELKSVYAFDRKKFLNKRIDWGEGLAGQAWFEGDLIYLTDIPDTYVSITSGLGEASPKSVLIVPVKYNDTINGVLEFASFKEFEPYHIEFIQKLSETLASALSTMKINEKTKYLLEESQKQRNQMHEQEEELRQNLEELQATQEEMKRKQEDTEQLIERLKRREQELLSENDRLRDKVFL